MGNIFTEESVDITTIHKNIESLVKIGQQLTAVNTKLLSDEEKMNIKEFYKTFYYPTHILTVTEEINSNHRLLNIRLKNHIQKYNKVHSTDIDIDSYVQDTYTHLQPTLFVIGL